MYAYRDGLSSERDDEGEVVELRATIVVVQRVRAGPTSSVGTIWNHVSRGYELDPRQQWVRAGPTSSVRDVQRVWTTTERRRDWTQHRLRDARTTGQHARRQRSTRRTVVALR